MTKLPRLSWLIFSLGVLALVVGPHRVGIEETHPLAEAGETDVLVGNGAFTSAGVVASNRQEVLPEGLRIFGSRLGSEEFQGKHETGWLRAAPTVAIMVSGFPMLAGNRLELETRRADGVLQRLLFDVHDIGEAWLR